MNSDMMVWQLLQNGLQAADLRQRVYANNIANADTPGFKRQDVAFESLLATALNSPVPSTQGDGASIGAGSPVNWSAGASVKPIVVQDDSSLSIDNNGNNVNIDAEMAKLAENQIRYNALIEDMKSRFDRMRTAINGG